MWVKLVFLSVKPGTYEKMLLFMSRNSNDSSWLVSDVMMAKLDVRGGGSKGLDTSPLSAIYSRRRKKEPVCVLYCDKKKNE